MNKLFEYQNYHNYGPWSAYNKERTHLQETDFVDISLLMKNLSIMALIKILDLE